MNSYSYPLKQTKTIIPAKMGKKALLTRRINVNRQPSVPTSIGSRLTAQIDHPVRNATMVPNPAPERSKPAAMCRLTKGPPGQSPPATEPIK